MENGAFLNEDYFERLLEGMCLYELHCAILPRVQA